MTYARWFDEGSPALTGDLGTPAACPDTCFEGGICGFCSEATCPTHGIPVGVLGEDDADDTHLDNTCLGTAHRACHSANCRDRDCWYE